MSMPDAHPGASCPPHHWLIEEPSPRLAQWPCLHCGAHREYERPTIKAYRLPRSDGQVLAPPLPKR